LRKPFFNKICIVGVGLIGGSLGMAIKKRKLAKLVVGVVRRDHTAKEAMSRKALDVATFNLKEGVRNADLVILCGPVSVIVAQLKVISKYVSRKTMVIDVGSSKVLINKIGKECLGSSFIGCHPMAGSEKTGVENACPYLFEKSVCFVTKSHPKLNQFWRALDSMPVILSAEKHDEWAARSSHLPHLLAFSIFQDLKSQNKMPLNPSLRSLARLARSNPELWADVFLSNRGPILKSMNNFEKSLSKLKRALIQKNSTVLKKLIVRANRHSPHHA